jgi:hypothetical protein
MEFKVKRTSTYYPDRPTNDIRLYYREWITERSMALGNRGVPSHWTADNPKHVIEGDIVRYWNKESGWFVQIETLEELLQFMDSQDCGEFVLTAPSADGVRTIEIYDDYRE